MNMTTSDELIRLENIYHSYGVVSALEDVNITIRAGEIHALVGEHGAGKSSLAMVMNGDLTPRSGKVFFRGSPVQMHKAKMGIHLGVKMIYQNVLLNRYFSVAESLFYFNKVVNRGMWINQRRMEEAASELFQRYGLAIDPRASVSALNISERTAVDILRSMQTSTNLLIIDEGMDNLTSSFSSQIGSMLHEHVARGTSILLITHKIEDIYDFAARVSIMRNGKVLTTDDVNNIDKMNLLRLTYTQVNKSADGADDGRDFYSLLKYNEAILQFLPINLIVVDKNNRIELVNDSCKKYFGLSERYFKTPLSSLLGKLNDEVYDIIIEALSSQEEKTFYRVHLVVRDRAVITNIKTLPIKDRATHIGNIIILEDVSEFERMQDKLILSEKLASIGLLAAGVAHEINNPLEIIYNYLAYLRYNLSDGEQLKAIDTVQDELVAISGIVSNLVTFSDNKGPERRIIDVDSAIEETLRLLKFNVEYKKITMSFLPGLDDVRVILNQNEFKQVILNLVRNSIEAMPDGGIIDVTTHLEKASAGSRARIIVKDSGPGIPEEHIKNIFLPFYSTKKGQESNLGLGLSICYSIVQRYNGTISASNNVGGGCSFTVDLPIAE